MKTKIWIQGHGLLVTDFIYPPIPDRRYDWCAWIDGQEESRRCGYGTTEQAAINDWKEKYLDEGE